MFVSPQNSYVEVLTLEMMVLGSGTIARGLGHGGHRGRALLNGICDLIKEA
jgi:hypothetical protein